MEAVLRFENVSFGYSGTNKVQVLKDVCVSFHKGVLYVIAGPSGSGKTTILSLAGALDEPQSGSVLFEGKDIRKIGYTNHRKRNVALVFQHYNLIRYMSALKNVVTAMEISGVYPGERWKRATDILCRLGLTEEETRRNVMRLSGGQQQRVAIARALASDAPVILADEPTGNLDAATAEDIAAIFKTVAHEMNKCVIVVTHSHELAARADVVLHFHSHTLRAELKTTVCSN